MYIIISNLYRKRFEGGFITKGSLKLIIENPITDCVQSITNSCAIAYKFIIEQKKKFFEVFKESKISKLSYFHGWLRKVMQLLAYNLSIIVGKINTEQMLSIIISSSMY